MTEVYIEKAIKPIIKAALIDISGTLHVGTDAILGAIAACQKLLSQRNNLKVLFLTNTSQMLSQTLWKQLRTMGFNESAMHTHWLHHDQRWCHNALFNAK